MAAPQAGNVQRAAVPSQQVQAQWIQLSVQLTPFNNVIAIDAAIYLAWTPADQQFILNSYMAAIRIGGASPVFLPDVGGQHPRLFLGPLHLFQQQGLMPQHPNMAAPYNMAMGAQAPQYNAPAQAAQLAAPAIQAHGAAAGVDAASGRAVQNAGRNKIPRPPNAWIMYRKHFHTAFVNNHPDLTNNQISGLIAAAWHAQPQPVKDWWFNKAAEAKAEHMRKYPDYQYKPRKSSEKKRRTKKKAAASASSTAVVVEVEFPHTITKLDGSPSQDTSNVQGFERIQPIQPIQPIAPIRPLKPLQPLRDIQAPENVQTFQVIADEGAENVQGVEVQAGNNNVELGAGISGGQAIGAPIDLEAEAGNNNIQVNNGTSGGQAIGAPIDLEAENVEVGNSVPGGEIFGAAMDLDAEAGDNNAELGDPFEGAIYLDGIDGQAEVYLQNLLDGGADDIAQATHDYYYGAYQGDGGEDFADDYFPIEDGEELAAYDEEYDRLAAIHHTKEQLEEIDRLFRGNY